MEEMNRDVAMFSRNVASKEGKYDMNFKEIVSVNVAVLETCAFMVPNFEGGLNTLWFVIRFLIYVVGIYGTQVTSEFFNICFVSGNIQELVSASFLFLTHFIQIGKVLYLYIYRSRARKLIHSINQSSFQPKSEKQKKTLENYIKASKIISFSFWTACVLTCIFWASYPFSEDELKLPLAGWYPFNVTSSPNFECTYIYQSIAAVLNGLSNISIDTLYSGLIMVICAQLNILNDSLINIRHFAKLELGHEPRIGLVGVRRDNALADEISPLLLDTMNTKLVECIVHHRCILEFANEFQVLFSYSILGQFAVSVIIICVTMFQLTLTPIGSIEFFSMVLYQYCMLLEIFLWCYFGNEVIVKSTLLTNSAYKCDWTGCSKEFRKHLLFFMTKTQTDLKIYAGSFFTLSLSTFVNIVKSSWSYFAVLMRVNK